MVGIIDVGGGMRGIYSASIYDFLLDQQIDCEYCLGIFDYVSGKIKREKSQILHRLFVSQKVYEVFAAS